MQELRIVRYFDKRSALLKTFLSLAGAHGAMALFSFATTILLANSIGAEEFGKYSYAIAIGGYVLTFALVGMGQTQIRDLVQFPSKVAEFVSGGVFLALAMLLITLFVLSIANSFLSPSNGLSVAAFTIAMVMGAKALDLRPFYDASDRMKLHVSFLTVERGIFLGGVWLVFFLFRNELNMGTLALLLGLSTFVGLLLQYLWARKRVEIRISRLAISRSRKIVRSNLWIWGALLATLSFGGLSKIVLRNISGDAELGGYAVAWQIVTVGSLIIGQVGQIGNPRLAQSVSLEFAAHRRFVFRYFVVSTAAGAVVGIPAIMFPHLLLGLFREEYVSVAPAMRILGGYVIAIGVAQVATQYLVAVRKEFTYLLIVIGTGFFGPILFWSLIPNWASTGAAAAVLISHGAGIILLVSAVVIHMRSKGRASRTASD